MPNSELSIKTEFQNEKTIVSDCFFTSPCKVAKPFYRDDGYTEIMIMCASPGFLAGDKYELNFDMADNTKTIISEQSYRKLYNTGDDFSQQNLKIKLGENVALYYVPYPVIPFEGSRFRSRTDIDLRPSSKIIYGEILSCGREGMGEKFAFTEFSSRTCVSVDGKPVFLDNSRLIGGEANFLGIGFFENYSCQGVFFLFGFDSRLESFTFPADDEIQAAISKSSAGYTIRALGNSANKLYKFMEKCLRMLI